MNIRFLRNVVLKGLALFIGLNLLFTSVELNTLARLSLYNAIFPGRQRLPFGENPAQSYNLSLYNLDAMFASHTIAAAPKAASEYRVFIIGDSSTWGILLHPEETLAGILNSAGLTLCGRDVRVYNLGYPTISLTKDLMILDYALRYHPDLIIWPVTLEAFPADKQLTSPLVVNNASRVKGLINKYSLDLDPNDPALSKPTFWEKTIFGQRRPLADLIRLQLYGVMWAATGIDQTYPTDYPRASTDLSADTSFHGFQEGSTIEPDLAMDVLKAGFQAAGNIPVILVNEPMLISSGINSELRYNFMYPRWAYDQYRQVMSAEAQAHGWKYLDLWDGVPADQFTNSAIHLSPAGEEILAGSVEDSILKQNCR